MKQYLQDDGPEENAAGRGLQEANTGDSHIPSDPTLQNYKVCEVKPSEIISIGGKIGYGDPVL